MQPNDYTLTLESIARATNRPASDVLEFFLERSAIREHDGSMPRGAAEEWAVEDCRAYFAMRASKTACERAARDADATGLDLHDARRSDSVASGEVSP